MARMLPLFFLVAAGPFFHAAPGRAVTLVKEGQAVEEIVVEKSASPTSRSFTPSMPPP
jgi:hypothetical protein